MIFSGYGGVLLEECSQLFVDYGLHDAGYVGIQFALGLAFELGLRQLYADHGYQAFADVVSGQIFFYVFEQAHLLAGVVDGAGQRGAEAGEMRASVDGVDVVGETENGFRVGVVVLEADFDVHVVLVGFHVDGFVVERLLAAVEVLDEFGDAAVVFEFGALGFAGLGVGLALVGERDDQALVQERQFAQALRERVEVVFEGGGENCFVGNEVNFGAGLYFGGAGLSQLAGGLAFGVSLLPGETVAPDFQIQFFAERVDAAYAYAVQASGNFVGVAVELAAGVQRGHDDLRGGNFFAVDVHVVDGNAASVVDYGDGVIEVDGDFDLVGVAG